MPDPGFCAKQNNSRGNNFEDKENGQTTSKSDKVYMTTYVSKYFYHKRITIKILQFVSTN